MIFINGHSYVLLKEMVRVRKGKTNRKIRKPVKAMTRQIVKKVKRRILKTTMTMTIVRRILPTSRKISSWEILGSARVRNELKKCKRA